MPLDPDYLLGLPPIETRHELTARDTILYALGVGVGQEAPTDPDELQFVYEEGLRALPTMAAVLAYPGFWAQEPKYRLTWQQILHGEQSIEIHRPLPVAGRLVGTTTIDAVYDKGPGKGALLLASRRIFAEGVGEPLATVRQTSFLRGDGGFGGDSDGAPKPHATPDRPPDRVLEVRTRIDQALLYRLSGDYNPLHVDPKVAAAGGFQVPILHGLATYGIVGRALLRLDGPSRPETVRRLDVRFSSPVYPGDRLELDVWREGAHRLAFRARVPERGLTVLQNGLMEVSP
ncbi:MAG TPA: MaoC/PaaZ C-terminal domain-containing protein [Caulobacteraceae bacterium]|nr:MaoC/PaaZ C-terminal domain-containing protein [Caulobacteraceae bacterium]